NDIAEEYIRVAGYDRIPATLFAYSQAIKSEWDEKLVFVNKAKKALAALGLYECVTYSFTTPKFKELLRLKEDDFRRETVELMNPLGEQVSVMRTTLIHSMLETVALNLSRFNKEGALFEVGRVYYPREKSLPSEKEMLCVALFGDEDFFTLKGVIENLFKALGAKLEVKKKVYTHLHDGKSAAIECKGVEVGSMGELHPLVQKNYDINKKVYIAEISLEDLMPLCEGKITFEEFSRYPEVERDLALVVDKDLEAGSIVSKIMNAGIPFIRSCEVFDVFESVQIGEGKKSVALRFRLVSFEKTLTDGEINSSMESILKLTEKEFGAKLRD
ncbi:MAG: hypothetical protein GX891_01555, partial [Clostridiales bacterium]|nr:hypothetical protein [Clostridiales bacterium]